MEINNPVSASSPDQICGCEYPTWSFQGATNVPCRDGLGRNWIGKAWRKNNNMRYSNSPYTGGECLDMQGARNFWGGTKQDAVDHLIKGILDFSGSSGSSGQSSGASSNGSSAVPQATKAPSSSGELSAAILFSDPTIASELKSEYMIVSGPKYSDDEFELRNDLSMIRHFKTAQAFVFPDEEGAPMSFRVMIRTPSSNKVTVYGVCHGNGSTSKLVAWDNSWKNSSGSSQELRKATMLGIWEVFNNSSSKCPGVLEARIHEVIDEQIEAGASL